MTPQELKDARHKLGLSTNGLAQIVRVESGRTVRRWEAGDREIPGPVTVLVELLLNVVAVRQRLGVTPPGATPR